MITGQLKRAQLIARREFLEHVRTRGFWLSLGTLPLVMLISLAIPLLSELTRPTLDFAVTDHSGWALASMIDQADARDLRRLLEAQSAAMSAADEAPRPLTELLDAHALRPDERLEARITRMLTAPDTGAEQTFMKWWRGLDTRSMAALDPRAWRARFVLVHHPAHWVPSREAQMNLDSERIFAIFEIPEDPLGTPAAAPEPVGYAARNLTNRDLRDWFRSELETVVANQRRTEAGVDEQVYEFVASGVKLDVRTRSESGGSRSASMADVLVQWGPVAFVYILWISIVMVTQMLMTSTVEEKTGKLIEVLLANASPVEIMAGKILGIASTGMVIVGTWVLTFVLAAVGLPALLGAPAAFDLGGLATNPVYIASFLLYFVLGYLFYAALLCGIGSLCNTLKEAQTLVIPIQGILFVPLLAMVPIGRDPSGTLANILTWIPPFTPFVMMNRAAQPPDAWVYAGTTVLMLAAIAAALYFGAKLFRVGVLMTGQPPTLGQLLRLLRAPVTNPGAARHARAMPAREAPDDSDAEITPAAQEPPLE